MDKDVLFEMYIVQNMRRRDIAKKLNISIGMVGYYIEKFGIKKPQQLQNELRKQTSLQRYGKEISVNVEKAKQTYLKKYGVDNPAKCKQFQEKIKQTNLQLYGVTSYAKTHNFKQIMKDNYKEIQRKQNITKLKNRSYNTSKIEDKIYELLLNKYKHVERNYFCELYPFKCDFYIPQLQLFIEYQGHWTHGNFPYIENDMCKQQLQIWKQKVQLSKFYKTAIHVWTELDVTKRNMAKQNKLNWLEFFHYKDFIDWYEILS